MRDLLDGVAKLRHEFMALGFEPPAAVLLKDHREGMHLLSQLHQQAFLTVPMDSNRGGKPVTGVDGSVWMEVEIFGMKILWPAERLAKQDGGFVWY